MFLFFILPDGCIESFLILQLISGKLIVLVGVIVSLLVDQLKQGYGYFLQENIAITYKIVTILYSQDVYSNKLNIRNSSNEQRYS